MRLTWALRDAACVPSPQSNNIVLPPQRKTAEDRALSGSGMVAAVPINVKSIISVLFKGIGKLLTSRRNGKTAL